MIYFIFLKIGLVKVFGGNPIVLAEDDIIEEGIK